MSSLYSYGKQPPRYKTVDLYPGLSWLWVAATGSGNLHSVATESLGCCPISGCYLPSSSPNLSSLVAPSPAAR